MSFVFPLVWILFFLIEEGFALAQRTKGKLHLGFSLEMFAFSQNTSFNKASVLHKTPWICINPESKSFLTSSLPFSFFLHSWASSHWSDHINNQFVCVFCLSAARFSNRTWRPEPQPERLWHMGPQHQWRRVHVAKLPHHIPTEQRVCLHPGRYSQLSAPFSLF